MRIVASNPYSTCFVRVHVPKFVGDQIKIEAAYAELSFLPIMWPDFRPDTLHEAVDRFMGRERRFGLTSEQLEHPLTTEPSSVRPSLQAMPG